ncbi:MAG: starch-binding protein [Alistipes sp.]|nr:starch-binding protein [Alistipes sp.]
MKKFWSIFTVALVALSAVSCSNNFEDQTLVNSNETLSFDVNIDNTRTALEQVDGVWKTVWVGNETIVVTDGEKNFNFVNTDADKDTFTCTAQGVLSLLGKKVDVVYNSVINSANGAAGMTLKGSSDSFNPQTAIELSAYNAFVKFTSTADVTFNASTDIFGDGSARAKSVTVKAGTDVLVPVYAAANVTFSAAFAGVKTKEATLTFANNKIYNLGTLVAPVASTKWGIVGSYHGWTAENPAAMYEKGDYVVAYNVPAKAQVKFIEIGKGWDGAVGGVYGASNDNPDVSEANTWHPAGILNILLPATGTFDVYYQPSINKYNIVAAGTTPQEYVAPTQQYKVYMYKMDNTWTKCNLYSWNSATSENYTGSWPGSTTTATETINGYTYSVWQMPASATGQKIMVIFNNGSAQTGDSGPYTLDKDLYLLLRGTAVSVIEDPNNPEPEVELQPRKIYATTTLSWSKMNLYYWGAPSEPTWPGNAMKEEIINGTKYYVYTFDKPFDGVIVSGMIFNNGSSQTVDIKNVKLDKDRFFEVLTSKSGGKYTYKEIADPR